MNPTRSEIKLFIADVASTWEKAPGRPANVDADTMVHAHIKEFLEEWGVNNVFYAIPMDWQCTEPRCGHKPNKQEFVYAWLYEEIAREEQFNLAMENHNES